MTRAEAREILGESVVAVILGNTLRARLTSYRLYMKYGISSILCGERKNLFDLFDLRCGFLQLFRDADDALTVDRLSDLSKFYTEQILIILPATDEDIDFLEKNRERLETDFIISISESELDRNPIFDILKSTPMKGE